MLLEASGLSKSYAGVHALQHVNFELAAGEIHALVGENGAGKSTLIKILSGAVQPDSGGIRLGGESLGILDPLKARSVGISTIYQQPALFPDLTVEENLAFSSEAPGFWKKVDWADRRLRAKKLLDLIGADIHPGAVVRNLSMPHQQLTEIARALGTHARVLILDEPTASLTERETEHLFQVLAGLQANGVGIIYISHRLEELFAIAERVTVLRDGRTVGTHPIGAVTRTALIQMMANREITAPVARPAATGGRVVCEARSVSCRKAGIRDVNFQLVSGEVLGLAGLVGSGRTQIAETLFGLTPADAGEILVDGEARKVGDPRDALALGIAYVPEDRRRHGALLEMNIAQNISLAQLRRISLRGILNAKAEEELAQRFISRLKIKAINSAVLVKTLSGGNQQKVALGRWLATAPRILLLDEPTQGIDVGTKAEIHQLVRELAGAGMAVLLISSELPELLTVSDRIAIVHRGTIVDTVQAPDTTAESLLSRMLGYGEQDAA